MANQKLDALDKQILKLIAADARIPFLEVARACDVSGAAIHQRIQKLTNMGVLNGSQFIIEPEKLGYETCAFIAHHHSRQAAAIGPQQFSDTDIVPLGFRAPVAHHGDDGYGRLGERQTRITKEKAWAVMLTLFCYAHAFLLCSRFSVMLTLVVLHSPQNCRPVGAFRLWYDLRAMTLSSCCSRERRCLPVLACRQSLSDTDGRPCPATRDRDWLHLLYIYPRRADMTL